MNVEDTFPADSAERSSELAQHSLPVSNLGIARSRPIEVAALPPNSQLMQINSFTTELFGTSPDYEIVIDTSEPEFSYVVATIHWTGDSRELIQRRLSWHDRARCLLPDLAARLRLSIMPS